MADTSTLYIGIIEACLSGLGILLGWLSSRRRKRRIKHDKEASGYDTEALIEAYIHILKDLREERDDEADRRHKYLKLWDSEREYFIKEIKNLIEKNIEENDKDD